MAVADLRLNMAIMFTEIMSEDDIKQLFSERAEQVRRGVSTSPRGLSTGAPVPYTGYYTLKLPGAYELRFEHTSSDSLLPLNMCARAHLGCAFYGPVFLTRKIGDSFATISTDIFGSTDMHALRTISRALLDDFKERRSRDNSSVIFTRA